MTPYDYLSLGLKPIPLYGITAADECECIHRNKKTCDSPGKHPRVRWQDLQTVTRDDIDRWLRWWPRANWAVMTGEWGSSGYLIVVDIDPRHGGDESAADLDLPDTWTVLTGSGGQHLWYLSREPVASAAAVRPGIDLRGVGGIVVVPPSRHASGSAYEWDIARNPETMPEPAAAPDWITARAQRQRHTVPLEDLTELREGERNAGLTRLIGSIIAASDDPFEAAEKAQALNLSVCQPPLPREEVAQIVRSLWRAELRKLRRLSAIEDETEDIAQLLGIPPIARVIRRAQVGEQPYSWRLVLADGRQVPVGHDILSWSAVASALVNHVAAQVPEKRPKNWAAIAARLAAMAEDDVAESEREIVNALIRSAIANGLLVIEPDELSAPLAQGKLVKSGDYLLLMPRAFLARARAERICEMSIKELRDCLAACGWQRRMTGEYAALASDYWAPRYGKDRDTIAID